MPQRFWFASLFVSVIPVVLTCQLALAQSADSNSQTQPQITQMIDEGRRVRLSGNTRPEANVANDRGPVAEDFPLEHMLLQLKRSPEREKALEQFIEELHTQASPNFHQWLTAREFGEKFGVAQQDLDTISRWLESHGLKVNLIYPSGMLIDFSGTAGQVREAFQTEIHELDVRGEKHIANMQDPQIPAAIAAVVRGIVSLHDFRPRTMYKPRANYTFTSGGSTYQAIVPGDLATIYNLNPLFKAGTSGQGQTIVVIEDTNVYSTADWSTFRSTFGLSNYTSGSFSQTHPAPPTGSNNCSNPGVNGDDGEAILDAEYASAAAPSAAIELASCSNTITTFGGLIALQNLLNESSTPPAVISISYGDCEAENGASANAAYSAAYQQAVTEGVSVFVAAGDEGAASCDPNASGATHGIGVSGFASTPYNVAVGGTDFGDTYAGTNSTYWSSSNTATYESAKSYIPEIPWNDSCASALLSAILGFTTTYGSSGLCNSSTGASFLTTASGSGGPSGCATGTPSTPGVVSGNCAGWAKPSWQSLVGNPKDGVRDIPDVSLFAANGLWGHYYVYCFSDPGNGGFPCTGAPSGWAGAGGTSFAAPILAAIQALVNQKTGGRQGNPNPTYYQLAASEYGSGGNSSCNSTLGNGAASSCIFYDVTQGDMDVNCTGSVGCYDPSGTNGVLSTSTSAYDLAYGTTTGWDFATGIGTLNATNLVNNWPTSGPTPDFSLSASPASVTVTQGNSGTSTISVTPSNGFTGSVSLSASGLPSGVNATFSPNPSTVASTLTLTASGTATTGTSTVTVSGTSGSLMHTTTVALTVNTAPSPAAIPIITPATGTYYTAQTVTISDATSGATIYYTTDGSQPTTSSMKYTASFQVSATATIKAIATAPSHSTSATGTSVITIWLNPAWTYRSSVTVANPGGTTLTAYQVHVALGASFDFTKALPNGEDIRFTANDGTTALPFWIESWNPAGSSASLWVKVPSIPATGTSLYMYYGNSAATSASSGSSTFDFFDDFSLGSIDTTKWTASGGTWSVVTGTEPNGQSGTMARGSTNRPPNQILYSSTYTGGDYIFEAYGLQQSGREWGVGARVNGPSNFYSANLYADLDTTNNLYEYKWLNNNGSNPSIHLGSAAVGTINLSTWYKLRMAVHGTSIDVYLNDVQKIHATDSQWATGGVALVGGENMLANFAYVRSRQYTATEPTVTVGGATTNKLPAV
jgi:subtilase family serine protease